MNGAYYDFEDNSWAVLDALETVKKRILEMLGILFEGYAKRLCPVGTPESTGIKGYRGGTLRNSITHEVHADTDELIIGTNVEYAPYVELGTGPYFTPPPEWENFDVPTPSGIGRGYVHARPFIRPAIEDHKKQAEKIAENELKGR